MDLSKGGQTIGGLVMNVAQTVNLVVPILMGLALVFFFWGLTKFVIRSSGNEKEIKVGREYMLWSILALFVLLTYRVIVGLISNEFGFGEATGFPFLPQDGNVPSADETIKYDLSQ